MSRCSRRTRGDISVYRKQTVVFPPFVSRDRETLKSRNPSALNLPNGEEGEEKKKRKHPPTHSGFVSEPFVMHR